VATLFSFEPHNKRTFMTGLDIPIEFMNIEELARRWKCTLSTIESLAETDKLKFCLRPAALEVALARIPLERYSIMVRRLASMYIDHRYVYLMFKDREHKIEIARIGNYDVKEILKDPLRVDFFDLVIPISQVEEFEFIYTKPDQKNYEFKLLSDDFSCFIWRGREYKFGTTQAKVIQRLWQAREDGKPWVYGKHILNDIAASSDRISNIFSRNKYWRNIIKSDGAGKYKLNLPPKGTPLLVCN